MIRPAEELYHTTKDPFEMTNLAEDPTHQAIKAKLSTALEAQLEDQGDPGIPLDSARAHKAAAQQKPLFPGTD